MLGSSQKTSPVSWCRKSLGRPGKATRWQSGPCQEGGQWWAPTQLLPSPKPPLTTETHVGAHDPQPMKSGMVFWKRHRSLHMPDIWPYSRQMAKDFSADNLQGFYMTIFYDVKILVSIVTAMWASTYPDLEICCRRLLENKNHYVPWEPLHISRVLPGEALLLSITSPFARC